MPRIDITKLIIYKKRPRISKFTYVYLHAYKQAIGQIQYGKRHRDNFAVVLYLYI